MLTSKQRAALRRAANGLQPVFQIGKTGLDEPLFAAVGDCLAARELVKLKLLETAPHPPREAADAVAAATGAQVVQVIGRTFTLFLQKPKESQYAALL